MNYVLILLLIHHVKSKFSVHLMEINLYNVYNLFAFFLIGILFITYFSNFLYYIFLSN